MTVFIAWFIAVVIGNVIGLIIFEKWIKPAMNKDKYDL